MKCPSCQKKVVFGSIHGEAWIKVRDGEWLYGGRPPALGKLGDCPVCGATLEWDPGEAALHDPTRPAPQRVHLSALRESPGKWTGKSLWMRALVIQRGDAAFLSDSWRAPAKGGPAETDEAMIERLEREQRPSIAARFATPEAKKTFEESSRPLAGGARAAWIEAEGTLAGGVLSIQAISSIWPPRD